MLSVTANRQGNMYFGEISDAGGPVAGKREGKVGDIYSLSNYVRHVFQDKDLALTLGQAGRQHAQQFFEQSRIVPLYLDLYEKNLQS